ncbi:unnamed protein product [Prunus brigantina]
MRGFDKGGEREFMENISESLQSQSLVVENLQEMEEEETQGDGGKKIRIHVGGLGGSVKEEDLHRMFGAGGNVEGVDIVRTKGRSFAYVDFLPASDKSLSKLLTTYNGCSWKGGKLRLHKAKEHHLVRLKREWAEEDAQLPPADIKPSKPLLPSQESRTKQLRIFFPALRTVKAVPFTGTGKHKYSFQRVQVPSLPVHFCDCEEHSVPSHPAPPAHQNQLCPGINEQELNIMNKVMDKLFQREKKVSVSDTHQSRTCALPNQPHHELPVATAAEEDNLIINIVSSNRDEDKLSELQELRSSGTQTSKAEEPSENVFKAQKASINGPPKKKRKSLLGDYNNQNEFEDAIPGSKKNLPTHSKESGKFMGAQPDQKELGAQHVSWSQKSSWKQLVGHRCSSTFSVSHVLTGIASSTDQVQPKSVSSEVSHLISKNQDLESNGNLEDQLCEAELVDGSGSSEVAHFDSKNQDLEGQLCEMELVDGCVEPQPTMSIAVSNKSGRGASWRQQSSWTQLVSDNSASSFSIKQIVPGISFEQQFVPKPKSADAVSSTDRKLKEIVKQDKDNDNFTSGSSLGIGKGRDVLISSPEDTVIDNDGACAPDVEKNCDLTPKQVSAGNVEIGETCSFMRSASSLKEWTKIKAALSGSLKRKNIEN